MQRAQRSQLDPPVRPAGFFLLRTPLLSANAYRALGHGLALSTFDPPAASDEALAEVLASDRARIRERLATMVADPVVDEALRVASTSLHARITDWLKSKDAASGAKVEVALFRYVQRMATRATPFGLFAGFSVGFAGARTELRLVPDGDERLVRVDMEILASIVDGLVRDDRLRRVLHFRPNRGLYEAAARIHCPCPTGRGSDRSFELVAFEKDAALLAALAAAGGNATRAGIAAALPGEATDEERLAYVDDLIDSGVLESDIALGLTRGDPLADIIATLSSNAAVPEELAHLLGRLAEAAASLSGARPGAPGDAYERVASAAADIVGEPVAAGSCLEVDLRREASATLGPRDLDDLALAARCGAIFGDVPDVFGAFKRAFVSRYEARHVPLMEVLDEEAGIGFGAPSRVPAPLLDGLPWRARERTSRVAWGARERLLLSKAREAWTSGSPCVRIEPEDLEGIAGPPPLRLPTSFAVLCSLLGRNEDADPRFVFRGYVGPSAGRLLGRFSGLDGSLEVKLREHLALEETARRDAVHAEIVHLPARARSGNLLLRPRLRGHEIVFGARAGVPDARVIELSDLLVTVRAGRVILSSRSLGCEVLPRLASAHNFAARSLTVYKFLCALQSQGVVGGGAFSWGPLAQAPELPRVQCGRVILAPRAFWLDSRALLPVVAAKTPAARARAVLALRRERRLPRYVGLEREESALLVDFENALSIEVFGSEVRDTEGVRLVEVFIDDEELAVRTAADEGLVNELVVPFLAGHSPLADATDTPMPRAKAIARVSSAPGRQHTFGPGSEWLYAKCYSGVAARDLVLDSLVRPLMADLAKDASLRGWFFVRFTDPDPHVRLRIRGTPEWLSHVVLPKLSERAAPLLSSGQLHRVDLATYEREVERYGGPVAVEIVERVFEADSGAAIELVARLAGQRDERSRWLWTLLGMDRLFADFEAPVAHRAELSRASFQSLLAESGGGAELDHAIAARYRRERSDLATLLGGALEPDLEAVFTRRSALLRPLAATLRGLQADGSLGAPLDGIIASVLHMWSNRMLRSDARRQELLMHAFLARHYDSLVARSGSRA